MKPRIVLVADLHLKPETEEVCFAALDAAVSVAAKSGAQTLALLGDTFHLKYAVSASTLDEFDKWLRKTPSLRKIILPGNHDQYDIDGGTFLAAFHRPTDGVEVYLGPTRDAWGAWCPFRKDPNDVLAALALPRMKAPVAFLHHGIVGARMNNGIVAGDLDGLPPAAFVERKLVFLGHWHEHQQIEKCVYVGSPWQTRSDEAGQVKGCVLLELEKSGEPSAWQHVPFVAGARHHKVIAGDTTALAQVQRGDQVHVVGVVDSSPTSAAFMDALKTAGADVTVEPPKIGNTPGRLGLPEGSSLRVAAERYAEANLPDGITLEDLMATFDDLAGEA